MLFCNECDETFSRKDSLVRHHRRRHPDSGTLPALLRSLVNSENATDRWDEPKAKRSKDAESDESETDDESVAPESSIDDASSDATSNASDDDLATSQSQKVPSPNIWEIVRESAEEDFDGNVLDAYVSLITSWRSFKKDVDHQKIMETVQRYREGSDAMDFHEALLKAVNKRKHLIRRKTEEAKEDEDEQ